MSDYTKLPRDIADCLARGGAPMTDDQVIMLAGYLAPVQEQLSTTQAENEALRARVAVQFDALTSIAVALKGAGNLTKEMHDFIVAATDGDSEAILLRKQAEAVEALAKRFQDAADKADRADEDESDTALTLIIAKSVALKEAYQLRQKAAEMKKAGGEK